MVATFEVTNEKFELREAVHNKIEELKKAYRKVMPLQICEVGFFAIVTVALYE